MSTTGLLDIAPEIRLSIYRELFYPLTVIISAPQTSQETYVKVRDHGSQDDNHLAVLFTCKTIRDEGRPAFLSHALFDLTCAAAINSILPLEFARITRMTISHKAAAEYLHARSFYIPNMTSLLRGKDEIQIEMSGCGLFQATNSPRTLRRNILARLIAPRRRAGSNGYWERDLLSDCISAMYPNDSDEATCTGIFLLLRPSRALLLRAAFKGKEMTHTERKLRYNREEHTVELLEASGEVVSVPVQSPRVHVEQAV